MAYTLNVGSIRCHILSDGLHYVDGGGFFGLIPRVLWEGVIAPDAQNLVPCDSRSLLIESDAGLILVDVGNGDKLPEKVRQRLGLGDRQQRLIGELARVGYSPEDIDIVLFTHFHGDHIGGATRWDTPDGSVGPVVATFPRARYIGQRIDLADASFPNERTAATYIADNFRPLLEQGKSRSRRWPAAAGGRRTDRPGAGPYAGHSDLVGGERRGEPALPDRCCELGSTPAAPCLGAGIRHHAHTEYGDQAPPCCMRPWSGTLCWSSNTIPRS